MRGKRLYLLILATILIASPLTVGVNFASATTRVYVDPAVVQTNPGESFTVDINIENAFEVAVWEFKMRWNLELTEFEVDMEKELIEPVVTLGDFFPKEIPGLVYFWTYGDLVLGYIQVGAWLTAEGYVSGDGTLCSITFSVTESGISDLDLYDVKLWGPAPEQEPRPVDVVEDGYFYTTKAFVDFTITPPNPIAGEEVTFDASPCWDPDGGTVVDFAWDFGDGGTAEGLVVTHVYQDYRKDPYKVTLTVVDDDGETWSKTKDLLIWRDISVDDIWFDITWWLDSDVREMASGANALILVTTSNKGTVTESFNVTIKARHDETGYEPLVVAFWENPITLGPGKGSGFTMWAAWFNFGWEDPAGYYTLTVEAVGFAEEPDKTNNVLSIKIRLTEANLIMARPDTRHFKISEWGDTLTFYGKVKNVEKLETPTAGLYCWVRFEILTPEMDVVILDTPAEYITNEEETGVLTASMTVSKGTYSVTAYAVFSTMSPETVAFYEGFAWDGALEGTSKKIKSFTVTVVP